MKKVMGRLSVSINFECPNCEMCLDAFDDQDSGVDNDEGQLWDLINARANDRVNDPWKNIGIDGQCIKCKKDFILDELEY